MPDELFGVGGYAPRDTSHGAGLDAFARSVEAATGGRISVPIRWNILDDGRPAADLLDLVGTGELAMCYFSTSYLGHRVEELNLLDCPYLFGDLDQAHRALDGQLGRALSHATEVRTGLVVLGYWDNGFRHLTNRIHPVRVPDDVHGMRVRLQPNRIHESMVSAWGAVPVAVDLARGIDLMRTGEVDAQENPLANTVAYGVHLLHPHATLTGHLYGARGIYANPDRLASLSRSDRDHVMAAVETAVAVQRRRAAEDEERLLRQLSETGTAFVVPTAEERDEFHRRSMPVIDRLRSELSPVLFALAEEA